MSSTASDPVVKPNPELLIQGKTARLIILNVHRIVRHKFRRIPLWSLVSDVTGHGSGYSYDICLSANLDPNQYAGTRNLKNHTP